MNHEPSITSFKKTPLLARIQGEESSSHRLQTLVDNLAQRCHADTGLFLAREDTSWRVMATSGHAVGRLRIGSMFSIAHNPSLSPLYSPERPDLPVDAEPLLKALGPVALGDVISCPVMANERMVGLLNLYTSWSRPFSQDEVAEAAFGAEIAASFLGERLLQETGSGQQASDADLNLAVSLLNHDLSTPIHAVLGFAELLSEGNTAAEEVVRYASMIKLTGEQLADQITRLVITLRLALGTFGWRPEELTLVDALQDLPLQSPAEGGQVVWDRAMVGNALSALAGHVRDAGEDSGISVKPGPTHIHMVIGSRQAEEITPLPRDFRSASVLFARMVLEAHGATIRCAPGGIRFEAQVPRYPERFFCPLWEKRDNKAATPD